MLHRRKSVQLASTAEGHLHIKLATITHELLIGRSVVEVAKPPYT